MIPDAESAGLATTASAALAARRDVWTRHWASGAPHSCVGSYGERYGGAFADFWRSVFRSLTDGQRVLDLATGNGALPRLLLELCPDTVCEIDAVDLAAIEPAWLSKMPSAARHRLRFRGGQTLEALAFADHTFDLIVSQYGIEYSDLSHSLPEMLRVLAAQGRVALVMHVVGSRPVELAKIELAHIEWLESEAGLLSATSAMIEPISRAHTAQGRATLANDPAAESARLRFNGAQDALRARSTAADGADVLFEVQNWVPSVLDLAARQGVAPAQERLVRLMEELRDSRLRLEQLIAHALTPERCRSICSLLRESADREVAMNEIYDRGHLMGCTLQAQPRVETNR